MKSLVTLILALAVTLISANLVDQEISELQSLIGVYEQKIELLKVKASNKTRAAKAGKL